ncbi:MAG: alpha/beta fold hydrolase [Actinobacteria bacterium]|nr:alpha/beta fold hydrolase [Actinomycetota bacterium]
MRARQPDLTGVVDRDGVPIFYEVHGDGEPALLLIPPSPITHSRIYKALLPHLARHHRVVTFDGRGNGRSGRPVDVEDHTRAANVADILAVLDATGTADAVLVTHCHAAWWAVETIASQPDRVRALVAIEPGVPYLGWALESTGEVLAAAEEAQDLDPPGRERFEQQCRDLGVPTLVIHGDLDVCQHVDRGAAFAELTGGDLVVIEGSGHLALVRDPVAVNRAIIRFVDRITGAAMRRHTWTRGMHRERKVLYLSSPIGLGHVRRDLAVAEQLRTRHPDIRVEWLAQHPVTTVLEAAGETIHPASDWLASESGHIASEAAGHDLHCFQALRRMDEILVTNFMVFQEVVEDGLYDLVIGDEAWDVDHFWHENPELKRGSHVWFTDFVGYLPMPDGGEREAYLTADYNAEKIEHIERFPRIRDRAIFVGNAPDVVPEVFGPDLPKITDWTQDHFDFSGYITGFTPPPPDEAAQWRAELGYADDEKICIVTVGGSGVGEDLLHKAIAAYPIAKRAVPELRMVVVAGPRIDPQRLPRYPGLEVHGYVERLYRHLCVCDLAVVQGGLTTTMELTAARRPFLYFPLGHHFEQTYHVRHRLDQYGAGVHMDYVATDPDGLAAAITAEIGRAVDYRPVETDGAERAAAMIAELI